MPSAWDIIWDLKRRYYCTQENQDLQTHNLSNRALRRRIQTYLDGRGCPPENSPEEYSYYFELNFGTDYPSQQKYILEQLAPRKVSLNVGQRALAGLLALGLVKVVFTTNFDEVLEMAYSAVAARSLTAYHLEGSYAALDALNREDYPLYAKLHGDFRFHSIKNLAKDVARKDEQIRKCFVAASNRYGMVVSGYSGRDENVMSMFHECLSQINPFPAGLYWTKPGKTALPTTVADFVEAAHARGVKAHVVEAGTFDSLLLRIWRQTPSRTAELDKAVLAATVSPVSINLPEPGKKYPLVRLNALRVTELPLRCGAATCVPPLGWQEYMEAMQDYSLDAVLTCAKRVLFFGDSRDIRELFGSERVRAIDGFELADSAAAISRHGFMKSFFEEALVGALAHGKPLLRRARARTHYLVVDPARATDDRLKPLSKALAPQGGTARLTSVAPGLERTTWSEGVVVRLEEKAGVVWLLLRPVVWVDPPERRNACRDFLQRRREKRFNQLSNELLSGWVTVLLGTVGEKEVSLSYLSESEYSAAFRLSAQSAYSARGD